MPHPQRDRAFPQPVLLTFMDVTKVFENPSTPKKRLAVWKQTCSEAARSRSRANSPAAASADRLASSASAAFAASSALRLPTSASVLWHHIARCCDFKPNLDGRHCCKLRFEAVNLHIGPAA